MRRGRTRRGRCSIFLATSLAVMAGTVLDARASAFADESPAPPAPPEAPPPAPPEAPPPAPDAPSVPVPGPDRSPDAEPAAPTPPAEAPPTPAPAPPPAAPPAPTAPPPVAPGEARGAPSFAPAPVLAPCDPCRTRRRFTARIDGGVTVLSGLEDRIGTGVPAAVPELSWDGVDYDTSIAARLGLEVGLTDCTAFEIGFTWYGSFAADGARPTGAFGFSPPPGGVSPQVSVSLDAEAEVYGARAAWWRTFATGRSFTAQYGAGARWIRFSEEGDATDWQPVVDATPSLHGEVTDDLLAGLLGARLAYRPSACWTLGVAGEVFGGWMRRDLDVRDTAVFSAGSHASSLEEDDVSWGFEVEVSARLALGEQIAVRGSVGLLYLADVNRLDTVFDFGRAATGVVQARDDGREAVIPQVFLGFELTF